jgi:ribosomal protein S16
VRAELEAQHRQRRDLRRTGIVRLAEAGATTPQIAAISEHGIDYCQRIIGTYLPRRTEVALGGMEAWEKRGDQPTSTVVRLASTRKR